MRSTLRRGFTLLELLIVIVILGIVSKFGIELLIKAYDYYIMNLAQNRFQAQSEVAVEQIASRLQYRIPGSEIVRQSNAGLTNFRALASATDDDSTTTVMEWVGYDADGWRGDGSSTLPTWSGFVDVDPTSVEPTGGAIISPESNGTRIFNVMDALTPGGVVTGALGLFFVQDSNFNVLTGFGWDGVLIADQTTTVHRIGVNGDQFLTAGGTFVGQKMYEFYKLSWTAYALEHNAAGEIRLHYDYRPWNGDKYDARADGTVPPSILLMENVDTFRFRSAGDALKVQVCIRDNKLFNTGAFSICKEKTVF